MPTLLFEQNFWGDEGKGFDALSDRLLQQSDAMKDMIIYVTSKSQLEEEFAKSSTKLCQQSHFKSDVGSVKQCLDKLNQHTEVMAKTHLQLSIKLLEEMKAPMEEFREGQKKLRKNYEIEMEKCVKAVAKERMAVERCQKEYTQKCDLMVKATDLAAKGQTDAMTKKDFEKIQDRALKSKRDMDAADIEYKNSIKRLDTATDVWEEKMTEVCKEFQKMEQDRIVLTKNCLSKVTQAQVSLLTDFNLGVSKKMRETVDLISVDDDIDTFVSTFKTGPNKPPRVVYQNFFETTNVGKASSQRLSSRFYGSLRAHTDTYSENGGNSLRGAPSNKDTTKENKTSSRVSLASSLQSNLVEISPQTPTNAQPSSPGLSTSSPNESHSIKSPLGFTSNNIAPSTISRKSTIGTLKEIKEMNTDANNSSEVPSKPEITASVPIAPARSNSSLNNTDANANQNSVNQKTGSKILQSLKADKKQFVVSNEELSQKVLLKSIQPKDQESDLQNNVQPSKLQRQISNISKIDHDSLLKSSSDNVPDSMPESKLSKAVNAAVQKPERIETSPIVPSSLAQRSSADTSNDSGVSSTFESPIAIKAPLESTYILSPPIQETNVAGSNAITHPNISVLNTKQDSSIDVQSTQAVSQINENKIDYAERASKIPKRTFTRRSIKMEGWLDVCDDSVKQWSRRWCALEGGYIWFFENPQDNAKPQGLNKPKSMVSIARSTVEDGCVAPWSVPDFASKSFLFTVFCNNNKRVLVMSAENEEDMVLWANEVNGKGSKK